MELTLDQRKAIFAIKKHLNVLDNPVFTDEYIMTNYGLAVDELIESSNKLKSIKTNGVSSISENGQSVTFAKDIETWTVTPGVAALLPMSFVKLMY